MVLQYCDVSGVDWDAPAPHRRQRWDWSGGGGALTEYLLQPVRGRQPPVRRLIAGTL